MLTTQTKRHQKSAQVHLGPFPPAWPGLARVGGGFSLSDKFGQVVAATLKTPKPPPGLAGKCEKDQVVLSQERQKGKHTLSGGLSSPETQVS